MKLCQPHWEALRTAVEAQGLGHLAATSQQDAVNRTMAGMRGDERAAYEPLIGATLLVTEAAVEIAGPAMLAIAGCPICTLTAEHKKHCIGVLPSGAPCVVENFDHLIAEAAASQFAYAVSLGLITEH